MGEATQPKLCGKSQGRGGTGKLRQEGMGSQPEDGAVAILQARSAEAPREWCCCPMCCPRGCQAAQSHHFYPCPTHGHIGNTQI